LQTGRIAHAVWAYHRFALSTAEVEDRLAERGVIISHETIRFWVNWIGSHFAACSCHSKCCFRLSRDGLV
jgi:putative transposase